MYKFGNNSTWISFDADLNGERLSQELEQQQKVKLINSFATNLTKALENVHDGESRLA